MTRPRGSGIVLLLSAVLGLAPILGAPVLGTNVFYTFDADFDKGILINVNHLPNHDQLQLNRLAKPFPFVNIAASNRGTVVRIDANTGVILGEYQTAPDGMARDPSRTTVDHFGNVWVTNRAEASPSPPPAGPPKGSIVRVGLILGGTRVNADGTPNPAGQYLQSPFEYNTCIDRDFDGLIKTSRGLGNILPWTNSSGVNTNGGVTTADDECIITYTRIVGTNARTVAIDVNNDAWVGGFGNHAHEKLDGVTGDPIAGTQFNLGCGGYGGHMDSNQVLWSGTSLGSLLRYDTSSTSGTCLPLTNMSGDYGIGIDPVTQHIWHTFNGPPYNPAGVADLNTSGTPLFLWPHGEPNAQGVAVDGVGNVWVAHGIQQNSMTVGHLRTNGTFVCNVPLQSGSLVGRGPTGVAVDLNGKIWVANLNSSNAMRIDPNAGPIMGGGFRCGAVDLTVDLGAGAIPYNYSDMTGFVALSNPPQGSWTVTQDGGSLGHNWGTITWNTEPQGSVPPGTSITVQARAADSQASLTGQAFVPVSNNVDFSLSGRFIEVQAILSSSSSSISPVLSDIRIRDKDMQCLPPPAGMISWWPADGDTSNHENSNLDGILTGPVSFSPGIVNQAFTFPGGARVEVQDNAVIDPTLEITGPITLDAWVKFRAVTPLTPGISNAPIVAKWGDNTRATAGYGLFAYADRTPVFAVSNNGSTITAVAATATRLPIDTWAHVAGVWDGNNLNLYVNGVPATPPTPFAGPIFNNTAIPLFIGGYNYPTFTTGPDSLIGLIDEVEIFNRSLSASEIMKIYQAGAAGKCK